MQNYLIEKGIQKNSAQTYSCYYSKLIKNVFDNVEPENMVSCENIDKVINYVQNSDFNLNTKSLHVRSWKKIAEIKGHQGNYQKFDSPIRTFANSTIYKAPTKEELENRIEFDYVIKMREEYKKKLTNTFTVNDLYYLLCSLYTYIPPLRSEDYYSAVIKTDTTDIEKENYYDLEKKQLVLNQYKTVKTYGQRIVNIPEVLAEIIENFHEKSKSHYLICTSTGLKLMSQSFNGTFKRCLKKEVSSSMLRKCYISDKIDEGMTAEERQKDAKVMGHSLTVQQLAYSKFSSVLHPQDDDLNSLIRRSKQLEKQMKEVNDKILKII